MNSLDERVLKGRFPLMATLLEQATLGVSVKDLQRIIEVDSLFGSRQQELQRTGRLLHADNPERLDIIMTEDEM